MVKLETYKPQVKDIALFKEMAQNTVNPLEVIREAISNAHDADAKMISIILDRNKVGKFTIEVQDDGKGLNMNDIHRFFNIGDSDKTRLTIGEKGLGTKIFFKSMKIVLQTQTRMNEAYKVIMEKPWQHLEHGNLPEYTVEKVEPVTGKGGTSVTIEGYIINNPEKYFNFETVKDYILWFSAAGSFKIYFANYTELHKYIYNMQIVPTIFIEDKINNIHEVIAGTHQFHQPQEKPKEDPVELIYKTSINYCRHFGPYHRDTNIDGEYVSFQMYGTISGYNCQKTNIKLRRGESIRNRFGVYLAKDFIPFVKKGNLLPELDYHHYHLLINSQNFQLTTNRNNISNLEDKKVKWVLEEAKKIIDEDIIPLAEEGYFNLRRLEEQEHSINAKQREIQHRIEEFDKIDDLLIKDLPIIKKPKGESQVAILFASMISHEKTRNLIKYINNIGYYSERATTDMICFNSNNEKVLVEVEYKLSSLFRHEHPYKTFDYVVCWSVDLDVNEKRKLRDGNTLCLIQENEEWLLKYGTEKVIPIIELREIIRKIRNE